KRRAYGLRIARACGHARVAGRPARVDMNSPWFVPDWPAPRRVRALCTTRQGGVSAGPYAGFNLAQHVGDAPGNVAANRALLRKQLPSEPLWLNQVHGIAVAEYRETSSLPTAAA